jgi:twitching motility protein PilU
VNIFNQRNEVAKVMLNNQTKIPTIDTWDLPKVLKKVTLAKHGLILVIGDKYLFVMCQQRSILLTRIYG